MSNEFVSLKLNKMYLWQIKNTWTWCIGSRHLLLSVFRNSRATLRRKKREYQGKQDWNEMFVDLIRTLLTVSKLLCAHAALVLHVFCLIWLFFNWKTFQRRNVNTCNGNSFTWLWWSPLKVPACFHCALSEPESALGESWHPAAAPSDRGRLVTEWISVHVCGHLPDIRQSCWVAYTSGFP